jgi:hypothetical protein
MQIRYRASGTIESISTLREFAVDGTESAIQACEASASYLQLYSSFARSPRLPFAPAETFISEALYFHLCRMKHAGYLHKKAFNRQKKHALADVFQDLVAFYLRTILPPEFEVQLEVSGKSTSMTPKRYQVDILIRQNGKNLFVIEAKTTIGWARPDWKLPETPYRTFEDRITAVSTTFDVPPERVIFILEEPTNVNRRFERLFWHDGPVSRAGLPYPVNQVYPLFMVTDPEYWRWPGLPKGICPDSISDVQIRERAKKSIVTPFERIVELIINA